MLHRCGWWRAAWRRASASAEDPINGEGAFYSGVDIDAPCWNAGACGRRRRCDRRANGRRIRTRSDAGSRSRCDDALRTSFRDRGLSGAACDSRAGWSDTWASQDARPGRICTTSVRMHDVPVESRLTEYLRVTYEQAANWPTDRRPDGRADIEGKEETAPGAWGRFVCVERSNETAPHRGVYR